MNILLITVVFGMLSGMGFKILDILRDHKRRIEELEFFLLQDEEWLENEAGDK